MSAQFLTKSSYFKLLHSICSEMSSGLARVEKLLERQKVVTYWEIGRHINRYLAKNAPVRGKIGSFYDRLSGDIKVSARTLQHCEQFFRYFPRLPKADGLSWSHYRFLLVLPEEKERLSWINRIRRANISVNDLRLELLSKTGSLEEEEGQRLDGPRRGALYTYRLRRAEGLEGVGVPWFVDCGFSCRIEAPLSRSALELKYIYTSEKTKEGYRLKVTDTPADAIYTYKAKMRRVIDGDSLLVDVDLGFGIWTEQRLRLRLIDTPELDTLAGQKTKRWLENELKDCPFVIVKTYKSDKYDRYLVDVFYAPGEEDAQAVADEGTYLNGRLVELKLAKLW